MEDVNARRGNSLSLEMSLDAINGSKREFLADHTKDGRRRFRPPRPGVKSCAVDNR
jgi:hypothetical protein